MSPFKEPQPRKNSVEKDGEKVIGGAWPPYERLGSEARWEDKERPDPKNYRGLDWGKYPTDLAAWEEKNEGVKEDGDPRLTPLWQPPNHADLEIRKAALEAACALQISQPKESFWARLTVLEAYLRDGTQPS